MGTLVEAHGLADGSILVVTDEALARAERSPTSRRGRDSSRRPTRFL